MWPNPQETADLVTEEILNGKLDILFSCMSGWKAQHFLASHSAQKERRKNHGNLWQVTLNASQILISFKGMCLLSLHGNDPEVTCIVKTLFSISGHFLLQGKRFDGK